LRVLTEVKRDAILQAAAKSTLYRHYRSKEELFQAISHENPQSDEYFFPLDHLSALRLTVRVGVAEQMAES
jgi:AcrR family transcriptional regulator